jgi:hypothetical protein
LTLFENDDDNDDDVPGPGIYDVDGFVSICLECNSLSSPGDRCLMCVVCWDGDFLLMGEKM